VAPGPANRDAVDGITLLGDLDRIEPPATDADGDTAGFVDRGRRGQVLGMLGDEPARPREAAGFLIGGRGEEEIAPQARHRVRGRIAAGEPRLRGEKPEDLELHRHEVLHVDRPAPVDVAVGDVARARVVRPAIRRRRHDVEMREQEEGRPARPVAVQPGHHGASSGDRLEDLGPDTHVAQRAFEIARSIELAGRPRRIGRIDRGDPDQVAERRDEPVVGRRPDDRVDAVRGPNHAQEKRFARKPRTNPPSTIATTITSRIRR